MIDMPSIRQLDDSTFSLDDDGIDVDAIVTVDIDKTLTDNDLRWGPFFSERCIAPVHHGPRPSNDRSYEYDHFKKICRPCYEYCIMDPDFVLTHFPDEMALATMKALRNDGVEVDGRRVRVGFHAITARPASIREATIAWLRKHGYAAVLLGITFAEKKRALSERLGAIAHVDDAPSVHAEFHGVDGGEGPSRVPLLLVHQEHNAHLPTDERHQDWTSVHDRIVDIVKESR